MCVRRLSKAAQAPGLEFKIQLTGQPNQVYRPGDIVEGDIILTPVQTIEPNQIIVSLLGRSTVNMLPGQSICSRIDKAPLLGIALDAARESKHSSLEPHVTYRYPFKFEFPGNTSATRNAYRKPEDQCWTTQPHDLPPTFWDWATAPQTRQSTSRGYNFSRVDYDVKAELICPGLGVLKEKNLENLTTSVPVLFPPSSTKSIKSKPPGSRKVFHNVHVEVHITAERHKYNLPTHQDTTYAACAKDGFRGGSRDAKHDRSRAIVQYQDLVDSTQEVPACDKSTVIAD